MMINIKISVAMFLLLSANLFGQNENAFQIARLKYNGGGDWYNDPSAEVNLLRFVSQNTNIKVKPEYKFVDISSRRNFFLSIFIYDRSWQCCVLQR